MYFTYRPLKITIWWWDTIYKMSFIVYRLQCIMILCIAVHRWFRYFLICYTLLFSYFTTPGDSNATVCTLPGVTYCIFLTPYHQGVQTLLLLYTMWLIQYLLFYYTRWLRYFSSLWLEKTLPLIPRTRVVFWDSPASSSLIQMSSSSLLVRYPFSNR